jgi:hypothetical protein
MYKKKVTPKQITDAVNKTLSIIDNENLNQDLRFDGHGTFEDLVVLFFTDKLTKSTFAFSDRELSEELLKRRLGEVRMAYGIVCEECGDSDGLRIDNGELKCIDCDYIIGNVKDIG